MPCFLQYMHQIGFGWREKIDIPLISYGIDHLRHVVQRLLSGSTGPGTVSKSATWNCESRSSYTGRPLIRQVNVQNRNRRAISTASMRHEYRVKVSPTFLVRLFPCHKQSVLWADLHGERKPIQLQGHLCVLGMVLGLAIVVEFLGLAAVHH